MDKEKFTKIHFIFGLYSIIFILFIAIVPFTFNNDFLQNLFGIVFGISVFLIPVVIVSSGIGFLLDPLNKIDMKHRNEIIVMTMVILNFIFAIGFFIYFFSVF